jgi:predicted secreted protein
MAKLQGKNLRWYVTSGSPNNILVGYSREDSVELSYAPNTVEPTKDDLSLIPEILPGSGNVDVTGTFSGSIDNTSTDALDIIQTTVYNGAVIGLKCVTGITTISGNWVVTSLTLSGARDGSQEWSVAVRAAGSLSFT